MFMCKKTSFLASDPKRDVLYVAGKQYQLLTSAPNQTHPFHIKDENDHMRSLSYDFMERHFII